MYRTASTASLQDKKQAEAEHGARLARNKQDIKKKMKELQGRGLPDASISISRPEGEDRMHTTPQESPAFTQEAPTPDRVQSRLNLLGRKKQEERTARKDRQQKQQATSKTEDMVGEWVTQAMTKGGMADIGEGGFVFQTGAWLLASAKTLSAFMKSDRSGAQMESSSLKLINLGAPKDIFPLNKELTYLQAITGGFIVTAAGIMIISSMALSVYLVTEVAGNPLISGLNFLGINPFEAVSVLSNTPIKEINSGP